MDTAEQPAPVPTVTTAPDAKESEARSWAMFMHLSVLLGKFIPVAGFIVPIVMWQMKKDSLPKIDEHGKAITNWILSLLIYSTIVTASVFFCIGVFLLIPLLIVAFVFPIIGALKANEGVVWKYPGSIPFL